MFDDFLYNFYRSIKLDKDLYKDKKIFENLSLFFDGLIIIISGFAGAAGVTAMSHDSA